MKEANFAFGQHGIRFFLPEGFRYETVESHTASALNDPELALNHALDHPVAGPSLSSLAEGKRTAAITVCDITRPAPNPQTLPPLLRRLHASGIPIEGVTILIATGLHREATPEEIRIIVGPEIASKYRIVNHDARSMTDHRYLGNTSRGTPVYIDERFVSADLHITLGFIEQHLMLGFSGGRKLVAPGVAAQETIKVIHSPKFMREPLATEGSFEENPLHHELLEMASMARHDFMLDVTLTQDRQISGVFAGSPVQAHAAGVDFLRKTSLGQLSGLADAVITSAAGHPLDLTFYQMIKGITAAQHIVKPGGRILTIGECPEGIGSAEFAEKLRAFTGYQDFLDDIQSKPVVIDQWQLEKLALVGLQNELFFYAPGATKKQLGALAERSFSSLEEAIAATLAGLPPEATVALVPDGPYAFARVAR